MVTLWARMPEMGRRRDGIRREVQGPAARTTCVAGMVVVACSSELVLS